ncbi:tail protein X [Aerobium aerolatum]|uniref:P2-like prophage tail protein X n=1 Tax=Aquamicrobium aerolatum DSM 21857 TaxID=1121003 RepID=A0A1I3SW15_9HYPH|nr:tail protein X [Aquamicrobium aerolatum]SFJ63024.1 P2-like prophage tail protein X [Aquamicrobium aerolatum DSM 21857]
MPTTYRTHHGEMIDAICRRAYGDESGYVEAVLDANPGLAAAGPLLPANMLIVLPRVPKASEVIKTVALWT